MMELDRILDLRRQLEARRRELKRVDEAAIMAALTSDDALGDLRNLALADAERPILDRALAKLQMMEREAREMAAYHERQKIPRPRGVITSGR